jgi:hypothetical protein
MPHMRLRSERARRRFQWSVFRGRCRRNLLVGLIVLGAAVLYGVFAASHFRVRGADESAFDMPLVRAASAMVPDPPHLRAIQPGTFRELYLTAVISDQHDVMFGLVVLLLRAILSLTVGGLGIVLVTAGATEWEIRSEFARIETAPPAGGAAGPERAGVEPGTSNEGR